MERKTLDDVWLQAATNHDTYSATGSDDEDLKFFAVGIAGEAGEMLEVLMPFIMAAVAAGRLNNLVKKKWRDGPNDDRDREIRLELADIAAYTFMACRSMGMGPQDLIDLVHYKQQKFLAKMDAQGNEQRDLQPVATAFDMAELVASCFRDIGDGPFVVERYTKDLGVRLGTATGACTDLGAWLMTHKDHPIVAQFVQARLADICRD